MVQGPERNPGDSGFDMNMAIIAVATMLLFGTSFWGLVVALEGIPPITLGILRAILVALFMFFLFVFMAKVLGRKGMLDRKNLFTAGVRTKRPFLLVFMFAVFSTALPNLFQNLGLTLMDPSSTSSLAAFIQGVAPVFTIILAVIFLREKLGKWKVAGLIIALPATAVLTTYGSGGIDLSSKETIGAFLNLLTALSYSISGILLKTSLNKGAKPLHLVFVNALYGTVFILPFSVITWITGWEDPISMFGSGIQVWLALIFVSIGLYGITAVLWYRVISSGELSRLIFYVFLIPVFSYFVGFILLGERLDVVQMISGAILLLGVGLSQIRGKKVFTFHRD
jgi:drug/metabolite transporter (DMT)-like permease